MNQCNELHRTEVSPSPLAVMSVWEQDAWHLGQDNADQVRRLESKYKRHGTLCLFGNFHVATGMVHIDPKARFRIVLDNLNTHRSESCVRFVAEQRGIDSNISGEEGRSGVLKGRRTRQAFLSDPLHCIHFYFLPKVALAYLLCVLFLG